MSDGVIIFNDRDMHVTFLAVVSIVVQRVAAVTGTPITTDCVLTFMLTSAIVNCALITVCSAQTTNKTAFILVPCGLIRLLTAKITINS